MFQAYIKAAGATGADTVRWSVQCYTDSALTVTTKVTTKSIANDRKKVDSQPNKMVLLCTVDLKIILQMSILSQDEEFTL